jgi:hypothetical protein
MVIDMTRPVKYRCDTSLTLLTTAFTSLGSFSLKSFKKKVSYRSLLKTNRKVNTRVITTVAMVVVKPPKNRAMTLPADRPAFLVCAFTAASCFSGEIPNSFSINASPCAISALPFFSMRVTSSEKTANWATVTAPIPASTSNKTKTHKNADKARGSFHRSNRRHRGAISIASMAAKTRGISRVRPKYKISTSSTENIRY